MLTLNYIVYRLMSSAIRQTPYFMFYGKEPSLKHMSVFGCSAWVHIPKEIRRKGKPKAKKMKFLGYERGSKAYRFLDGNRNVVISRSVSFCEHENWDRVHGNSQVFIPNTGTRKSENRQLEPKEEEAEELSLIHI